MTILRNQRELRRQRSESCIHFFQLKLSPISQSLCTCTYVVCERQAQLITNFNSICYIDCLNQNYSIWSTEYFNISCACLFNLTRRLNVFDIQSNTRVRVPIVNHHSVEGNNSAYFMHKRFNRLTLTNTCKCIILSPRIIFNSSSIQLKIYSNLYS